MRTDISRWRALWKALHAAGDPAPWHHRLLEAYGESRRRYHNLQHLEECLAEFDRVRAVVQQPATVEAALWFHDVVYDPRSPTNEEDSAAVAVDCLNQAEVDAATIDLVRRLVLSTKTHESVPTDDGRILIDIDLAILGQPTARFWDYEQAIREEYEWVPPAIFAEKRVEILERFLARPTIYLTELFRVRYELTARTNLEAAISRLSSETK